MSNNPCDTKVSMIFNLLLANTSILSCFFFLFLVILSNVLIIPVVKENTRVNFALVITAGAPVTVVKEIIDTSQFIADKTIKILTI